MMHFVMKHIIAKTYQNYQATRS